MDPEKLHYEGRVFSRIVMIWCLIVLVKSLPYAGLHWTVMQRRIGSRTYSYYTYGLWPYRDLSESLIAMEAEGR
ncbi:hypothetical protein ACMA5I_13475 [Paracoccaceae bacterium GXU_MW_L88]